MWQSRWNMNWPLICVGVVGGARWCSTSGTGSISDAPYNTTNHFSLDCNAINSYNHIHARGNSNTFYGTYNVLCIVANVFNITNSDRSPLATAECIQGLNDLVYWGPILYFNCTPPVVSQATAQLEDLAKVCLNTANTHIHWHTQLKCILLPVDSFCSQRLCFAVGCIHILC